MFSLVIKHYSIYMYFKYYFGKKLKKVSLLVSLFARKLHAKYTKLESGKFDSILGKAKEIVRELCFAECLMRLNSLLAFAFFWK